MAHPTLSVPKIAVHRSAGEREKKSTPRQNKSVEGKSRSCLPGPLLQFWGCGCVTNQVIALGRVHPLHPKRRPPLPAHLGGRGVEKGGPMQVYILVKTQPGAAWHLLQAFQLHSGDLHPEVLKNLCNNKRFLKWAMSVIKYCTVKCFIQQDCSSTGNWTNS